MSEQQELEEVVVEYEGQRYMALRDKASGLLVCPICRRARFATPADLTAHILAHAKGILDRRRPPPERAPRSAERESS